MLHNKAFRPHWYSFGQAQGDKVASTADSKQEEGGGPGSREEEGDSEPLREAKKFRYCHT